LIKIGLKAPLPRHALRDRGSFYGQPGFWLLVVLALTVLVYVPGLSGPFVFDDTPNLKPLQDWLNGVTGWQDVLLGNRSGVFGRPLSMLSFILDAKLFGMAPFSFKLTNLLIHLACGALVFSLLRKLLLRDPQLRQRAPLAALAISAIWLLHPLQVSTVLYIVQRMAQLSTLFILLALLAYMHGREALEQGRLRASLAWLFLAVPVATALGLLCKENGALAPLLCAVLELGYFRASAQAPRPRAIKLFFLLGLLMPMLAVSLWYAWPPSRLLASYSIRTFTLGDRLLSEPRALFDYIGALLLPRGPTLGVYTDDFLVSEGLLQPVTTLLALIGLLVLIVVAIAARRRAPAVFTGIAFYLAGHVMESSVFPLELYFEHRNYLPSIGIFLALAGVLNWLLCQLPSAAQGSPRSRLLVFCVLALCAVLATATAARAWVWQSWSTMVRQAVLQHPNSTRAQFDNLYLVWHLDSPEKTRQVLADLAKNGNPETRHLAVAFNLLHECEFEHSIEPKSLGHVAAMAGSKLQLSEMLAFDEIGVYLRHYDCAGLSKIAFADTLRKIVDATPQPQSNTPVWRVRFMAADLYARGGQPDEAQRQAALAWNTGAADPAIGILLANLQIYNHDFSGAHATRAQLQARVAPWDRRSQAELVIIDQKLAP
jgi:hypothetical protein